jgi:hypothetical protein
MPWYHRAVDVKTPRLLGTESIRAFHARIIRGTIRGSKCGVGRMRKTQAMCVEPVARLGKEFWGSAKHPKDLLLGLRDG